MPQLADSEYRRCAHSALIEMAQADGNVTEDKRLVQEALLRPFYANDTPEEARRIRPHSRRETARSGQPLLIKKSS